ncbi:hypothetical protein GEMRC1_013453 [Eukaryota sp. GEM-RC1]
MNDSSLLMLSAPQGLVYEEGSSLNYHQDSALSSEHLGNVIVTSNIDTSSDLTQFRHNVFVVNSSHVLYNTIDIGSFSVPNDVDSYTFDIVFGQEFIRLPEVYLFLEGFSVSNSSLTYRCEISNITFTGFSATVVLQQDSDIHLSITYLAFDEHSEVFDLVDVLLIGGFICLLLTALLAEIYKPNLKGSPNTGFEAYHDLKKTHFNLKYNPLAAQKPIKREDVVIPHDPDWIRCLEQFNQLRVQLYDNRDTVGKVFWMTIAVFLVGLLIVFYKEYILATKFFHQVSSVYVTLFILGLEHFLIVLAFFTISWPSHRTVKGYDEPPVNVAILIASHMSAGRSPGFVDSKSEDNFFKKSKEILKENQEKIQTQFTRALRLATDSVADGNVYVCHNTTSVAPDVSDETVKIIYDLKEWGRTVNYIYVPCGNKTFSLYYVC